ncbi:MAG: GGDEF domain-containing protein [Gemmatimonadota bacterium]
MRTDRRALLGALQGLALGAGAPAGWLLIQKLAGRSVRKDLAENPGLYLYMLSGSALVFGAFGLLLGDREARLLATNASLADAALTDSLTGLRNARYLHTRLDEAWAQSERTGRPLALVVIDLDRFKWVNDHYGHPVGDQVLTNAAAAIAATTRQGETEARVGGEEFALLLPNSTGEQAHQVAERVRRAIGRRETPVATGGSLRVTASAGVASTAEHSEASPQALYAAADAALYAAKEAGRDRTEIAGSVQR